MALKQVKIVNAILIYNINHILGPILQTFGKKAESGDKNNEKGQKRVFSRIKLQMLLIFWLLIVPT